MYPTSMWGPPLWKVLHTLAEREPHDDILTYWTTWDKIFLFLGSALPCSECATHCKTFLADTSVMERHPRDILLELHNDVNRRRGLPCWNDLSVYVDSQIEESLYQLRGILIEDFWMVLRGV